MSDERDVDTGGGSAIGGDVDAGEFSGRDHIEQKVVVYTTPKKLSAEQSEDELMAEVASEIWKTIGELNRLIGELKASGETQARATDRLSTSIDNQSRVIERQQENYVTLQNQVNALRRIELALRGSKMRMPDGDQIEQDIEHPVPVAVQQQHKWQPFLTPAILFLILLVITYFGATGGLFP